LVLAFVAGFILFRLYATLGRRTGAEPPPRPAPAQGAMPGDIFGGRRPFDAPPPPPGGDGMLAITRADPSFDPEKFTTGARGAYEQIVGAFARGDREALKPLLTPRVYETYVAAIAAREAKGEPGPELVRLRTAQITDADLNGSVARVSVRFESELAE